MVNIYDGCINNSEMIYGMGSEEFNFKLDQRTEKAKADGQRIVFVEGCNSILSSARVVVYDIPIPEIMQNYKYRIVKLNGRWTRNGLLGYCDKCNNYAELTCLCEDGHVCGECSRLSWK